jgi:putative tryptophan/tyrosine transport system substrate-binding protein
MGFSTVMRILTLAVGICAVPLGADAQPSGKVARIGMLSVSLPRSTSFFQAFEHRLRDLGYVEGQNLSIAFRTGEGKAERLPALVAELVDLHVDVLLVMGSEAPLRAARDATRTIPIVMVAISYDPIARGYIAGLPQPGGNITGLFFQQLELTGKRLELLKDVLPHLTRVAVLWDAFSADQLPAAEAAARGLGVHLQPVELRQPPYDYASAFRAAAEGRAEAVLLLNSPVFFRERAPLLELLGTHRLPAIFGLREFVDVGGLMAYGVSFDEMFRRAATYVDKILKGAKPADLPVEQPTKFELVINLKTAQALGIIIPPTLVFLADEVIK